MALERKINLPRNNKLKEGYHGSFKKNLATGMLQLLGNFEDLKEEFCNSTLVEVIEHDLMVLAPTHLVVQSKEAHKIRATVDFVKLNSMFLKEKTL